jgi:NitT/TauT family transport system permease protein
MTQSATMQAPPSSPPAVAAPAPLAEPVAWLKRRKELVIDILVVAALWQLSSYFLPPILAPSLGDIGRALIKTLTSFADLANLGATVARLLVSLVVSFLLGGVLGVVMALSEPTRRYVEPLLHMIQGIPALSWVVFAVIWFAQVEPRILFVLIITTVPNFALHIQDAVRAVPRDLWELTRAFRATRLQTIGTLVVPAVVPEVLTAWKVNVGNATRVAVVAELVGATLGIGYQLLSAQQVFNMAGAIAWTIDLVLALAVIQMVLSAIERYLLRWRPPREAHA